MNKYKSTKDDSSIDDDKMKPGGSNKKLTSMWRYFIGDQAFNNKTGNSKMNKNTSESVIGRYQYLNFNKMTTLFTVCCYLYNTMRGSLLLFQEYYPMSMSYRLSTYCTIL